MDSKEFECLDPWFQRIEQKREYEDCAEAGYFPEEKPWGNQKYGDVFDLPKDTYVIQYSGAFYPFHEGHLEVVKKAVDEMAKNLGCVYGTVVIHIDYQGYRKSKGTYSEESFMESFSILDDLFPYRGFEYQLIFEDKMENACSRNFTRLYQELYDRNDLTFFVCGGDRANFCLAFLDKGNCMVIGRSNSPTYRHYKYLDGREIWFVEGNNPMSSTLIRNKKS